MNKPNIQYVKVDGYFVRVDCPPESGNIQSAIAAILLGCCVLILFCLF